MRKNSVSLTMIVRNESANLEACLLSAREQVDEIVIVDTGSTDETRQIAERYTDRVFLYPWDNDFSAARNYAIGKARGEWILSLDADEQLIAGTGDLRRLVSTGASPEAYMLPLHYPTTDAPGEYNRFLVLRLFKNNGRYRFKGRIHEQIVVTASG
ncbi:MAG: glycosyltransferase family 2 protein, partial [Eubacteriales bacterium]|nr:glycosyltransferase family 2 protein [Eubacteriales bacterium]